MAKLISIGKGGLVARMTMLVLIPMLIVAILLAAVSSAVCYITYTNNYEDEAISLAEAYATATENLVASLSQQFDVVTENPDIVNESISLEERKAILNNRAATSTFKDFSIAYPDGKTYNDTDISARDYFNNAMASKGAYVSSPVLRMTDNSLTIMMGKYFSANGQDYLVYGGLDTEIVNNIIKKVHFGENGVCFIVDKDGQIIAASNTELFPILTDLTENPELDGGLADLGSMAQDMLTYTEGTGIASINGSRYYIGYAPIQGAEGWSIAVATPWDSTVFSILSYCILSLVIALVVVVITMIVARFRVKKLCAPIIATTERLAAFAEGDITSPAPTTNVGGEIQSMAESLGALISNMQEWIGDIRNVLASISDGDLTVAPEAKYKGDFVEIRTSLDMILQSLRHVMEQVGRSSTEVREGASQLVEGSSMLSQNAINQAAEMEQITNIVLDIAAKTEANSTSVKLALDKISNANLAADESSRSMSEMLSAIGEIEQSSIEIEQIMKVIDDIAFQTNILALNAAIEAARAGDAGKGFAVVADEVRNLASKSAEAAQQTGVLITKSIEAVNRGAKLADSTSEALGGIVSGVSEVADVMGDIAAANEEQTEGINRISAGMDSVNTAIHNTSATAEESAAASEELSALAVTLSDEVGRFRI